MNHRGTEVTEKKDHKKLERGAIDGKLIRSVDYRFSTYQLSLAILPLWSPCLRGSFASLPELRRLVPAYYWKPCRLHEACQGTFAAVVGVAELLQFVTETGG